MSLVAAAVMSAGLALICLMLYRRSEVEVRFGILERSPDGGDYLAKEVLELRFALRDALRFGLVFVKRSPGEFTAQVVHYMPEKPKTLEGSIELTKCVSTRRGFQLAGPVLKYEHGGVRVLGFSDGDPIGKYELDLLVDGKRVKTIRYRVVPPSTTV